MRSVKNQFNKSLKSITGKNVKRGKNQFGEKKKVLAAAFVVRSWCPFILSRFSRKWNSLYSVSTSVDISTAKTVTSQTYKIIDLSKQDRVVDSVLEVSWSDFVEKSAEYLIFVTHWRCGCCKRRFMVCYKVKRSLCQLATWFWKEKTFRNSSNNFLRQSFQKICTNVAVSKVWKLQHRWLPILHKIRYF